MSLNSVAPSPRIVIFHDDQGGFPKATALRGNIDSSITIYFVLAFLGTNNGSDIAVDAAKVWENYSNKQQYVGELHEQNIKIMVSVGGGNVQPITHGKWDATVAAKNAATFAKQNVLDGVDLDWEDSQAYLNHDQASLDWIVKYTETLHNSLAPGSIISHSPASAYFCPSYYYENQLKGMYFHVDKKIGSLIDFYNVMFYDSGNKDWHAYETVEGLIEKSMNMLPGSALLEIAAYSLEGHKVPINKLVIGKPVHPDYCISGGYMPGDKLGESVQDAMKKSPSSEQWKAGIMGWKYNGAVFHTFADPSARALAGK